jgi:hypothetical protein
MNEKIDRWVEIDDLIVLTKTFALAIVDWCEVEP